MKADSAEKSSFLTPRELGAAAFFFVLVSVLVWVGIKPMEYINNSKDQTRESDLIELKEVLGAYVDEHDGNPPTYANERPLPTITSQKVLDQGVDLSSLNNIEGKYLDGFPTDPDGKEYKVGLLSSGQLVIGIQDSSGELITE